MPGVNTPTASRFVLADFRQYVPIAARLRGVPLVAVRCRCDAPVTLPEAVLGGKIEAPTVYGVVNVTVPRGSNTGTSLRLKGKGLQGAGKSNGAKGDEFVHLRVVLPKKPDKAFIRFLDEWAPGKAYKVRAKDWAKHPAGK